MYDQGQPPPPLAPPAAADPKRAPWIVATAVAIIVFDLFVAGSIIERMVSRSMTPEEYSAATGNGVVPGPWLVMPFFTVVGVIPLAAVSGLIGRSAGQAAMASRPGRASPFLVTFTIGLGVLSVAAMWLTWAAWSAPAT